MLSRGVLSKGGLPEAAVSASWAALLHHSTCRPGLLSRRPEQGRLARGSRLGWLSLLGRWDVLQAFVLPQCSPGVRAVFSRHGGKVVKGVPS